MLIIDDLLTLPDIVGVDATALQVFAPTMDDGTAALEAKRRVVVDDWLRGSLVAHGFQPERHSIRRAPAAARLYTGGLYVEYTPEASDPTAGDVPVGSGFASLAQDALLVRATQPFRGLWVTVGDGHGNLVPGGVSSPSYWNGTRWAPFLAVVDRTTGPSGPVFSGGGLLSWQLPSDWQARAMQTTDAVWGFWLRLQVSSSLSPTTALTQALPVRQSRLTLPCVYKTLALVYDEAWGVQAGEWREKATQFHAQADAALLRALPQIRDEFLTDDTAQAVTVGMANSTAARASLFTLERG